MTDGPVSPITYRVPVLRLPQNGLTVTITPGASEAAALAEAHGLTKVEGFRAELLAARWQGQGVRVTGAVRAEIEQPCIVTLAPVHSVIEETVDQVFLPAGSRLARLDQQDGELLIDPEGPDLPELFEGEAIDLGALVEEVFALGIDPYPRVPGASLEGDPAAGEPRESPFAALAKLLPR